MDDLTFFVAFAHAKVRMQRLALHPDLWRFGMTPKLQGLAQAMGVLRNDIEAQADKLIGRVETARARSGVAFAKAHATLDAAESGVREVEDFVSSLEGSNGGPSLDGSEQSSENGQVITGVKAEG